MDDAIIVVDDDQEPADLKLNARVGCMHDDDECKASKMSHLISDNERCSPPSSPLIDLNPVGRSNNNINNNEMASDRKLSPDGLPCAICGSASNGYHFGALSCAACNAFFRRSVSESRKYFCRKDGNCNIDRNARCFCRACRLKKCLDKGMDPNAVQPHRDMIGQKRKRQLDDKRIDVSDSALTVAIDNVDSPQHHQQQPQLTYKLTPLTHHSNRENIRALSSSSNRAPTSAMLLYSSKKDPGQVPNKLNGSATAQLLASPSVIAEQLLAFSRTPLISAAAAAANDRSSGTNSSNKLTANVISQSLSAINSSSNSIPESLSVTSSLQSAPFPVRRPSDIHRARNASSLSECPPNEINLENVNDDKLAAQASFDMYSRDGVEREEIVEHYSSGPSTSSSWYYEDVDGKQWQHHSDSIPRDYPLTRSGHDRWPNQIEYLVQTYAKLRERRRLVYCPGTLRDILGGTEPPLRPSAIAEHCDTFFRIEIGFIAEFINSIHPYSKLRLEDRILLFKELSIPYILLEKHYVTMRLGGYQANRIINTDLSYHDLTTFVSDSNDHSSSSVNQTNNNSASNTNSSTKSGSCETRSKYDSKSTNADKLITKDPQTTRRILLASFSDAMHTIVGPMYHFGMTDAEFVALVVVLLFDPSIAGLSEPAKRMVKDARDRMYRDWFAYYEAHGISDGAQRVGNAMLILPALKAICDQYSENYHLVRFFGLFEVNRLVDEVML